MGWFTNWMGNIKEATRTEPVECPRGWGQVTFQRHLDGIPPFCSLASRCPIGGVGNCTDCKHPYNPANIDVLRQALRDLEELKKQGLVTDSEFDIRRRMIIFAQDYARPPGQGFVTAAWILAPLGMIFGGIGGYLTLHYHIGFVPIGVVGAILFGLSVSFGVLGSLRRRSGEAALSRKEPDW